MQEFLLPCNLLDIITLGKKFGLAFQKRKLADLVNVRGGQVEIQKEQLFYLKACFWKLWPRLNVRMTNIGASGSEASFLFMWLKSRKISFEISFRSVDQSKLLHDFCPTDHF